MNSSEYKYDVAISFAEEDRNAALALSLAFEILGVKKVFYYPDRRLDTIGESTCEALKRIFEYETRYAVALWSKHYFDPAKTYVGIEWNAIKRRMHLNRKVHFMIPVKLSESFEIEDFDARGLNYFPWNFDPKTLAGDLSRLLGSIIEHNKILEGKSYYFIGNQQLILIGGKIGSVQQTNRNKKR